MLSIASLTFLDLSWNNLEDWPEINSVGSLQSLILTGNKLGTRGGKGIQNLCKMLCGPNTSRVSTLNISQNEIDDTGAKFVSDMLEVSLIIHVRCSDQQLCTHFEF